MRVKMADAVPISSIANWSLGRISFLDKTTRCLNRFHNLNTVRHWESGLCGWNKKRWLFILGQGVYLLGTSVYRVCYIMDLTAIYRSFQNKAIERLDCLENAPFSFDIYCFFQKSKMSMALYFGTTYSPVYGLNCLFGLKKPLFYFQFPLYSSNMIWRNENHFFDDILRNWQKAGDLNEQSPFSRKWSIIERLIDEDALNRTLFGNQHGQPGGTAGSDPPQGRHTGGPRRVGHQHTVTHRGDRQNHCAALLQQSWWLSASRDGLGFGRIDCLFC